MGSLGTSIAVLFLIGGSAVCSGLNIAFMSLKVSDLRRKAALGDRSAQKILPLREVGHLTLASILLTNVALVSATSLVLSGEFNSWLAGIVSTLLIVIFGEVIPQALFASHALTFCAVFTPLLRIMVVATYPISKPLQLLLDALLGKEISPLQSRHELGLLIGEHAGSDESELDNNEVDIIRGALELSEKRVRDIMTPISKVFWLAPDTIIDERQVDEIKLRGWSRIPVINRARSKVYGVLHVKDLVDMDFGNGGYNITDLPLNQTRVVGNMTALDTLFHKFITARSHLIPVEKDDKIVGIVTIEDLIEEIIGHEIEDESDRARQSTRHTRS